MLACVSQAVDTDLIMLVSVSLTLGVQRDKLICSSMPYARDTSSYERHPTFHGRATAVVVLVVGTYVLPLLYVMFVLTLIKTTAAAADSLRVLV